MSAGSTISGQSLEISLTEAVVFLRGALDLNSTKWRAVPNAPPAVLRGLLLFNVDKPMKIKSIDVVLEGRTRTEWPEGLGARRVDVTEERHILKVSTTLFEAPSSARRNVSLGPGVQADDNASLPRHSLDPLPDERLADDSDGAEHHLRLDSDETDADTTANSPRRLARSQSVDGRRNPNSGTPSVIAHSHSPALSEDDHQDAFVPMSPLVESVSGSPPTDSERSSGDAPRPRRTSYFGQGASNRRSQEATDTSVQRSSSPPPPYVAPSLKRASTDVSHSGSEVRPSAASSASRPPVPKRFSMSGIMGWGKNSGTSQSSVPVDATANAPVDEPTRGRSTEQKRSTWSKLADSLKSKEKASDEPQGWVEFKKGMYSYPISFAIPADTPPTLQCTHGATTYRLKACVHRPGTFSPRIVATREVVLVAAPSDDDLGDVVDTVGSGSHGIGSHVHIERQWELQLRYLIVIGGRGAPIGGRLPLWITLMPLSHLKVFRVSILLEERVAYYAHKKQTVRTDPLRRWDLLSIKHAADGNDSTRPILPVEVELEPGTDDNPMDALASSPLYPYICADPYSTNSDGKTAAGAAAALPIVARRDDALVNMLSPDGPWMLQTEVTIPSPCGRIHASNRHPKANAGVHHLLKIVIRCERADEQEIDPKTGKKKQFDIVVQSPLQVLSCRCNSDWTSLPTYNANADADNTSGSLSCVCVARSCVDRLTTLHYNMNAPLASSSRTQAYNLAAAGAGGRFGRMAYVPPTYHEPASAANMDTWGEPQTGHVLPENSRRFERLMSGLESPTGDEPPQYQAEPMVALPRRMTTA